MASSKDSDQLTPKQIVRLARAVTVNNMAAIAEGYMDIDDVTIKNTKSENKDDAEGFNREIIKIWRNKNPDDQIKVGEFPVTCKISDIEGEGEGTLIYSLRSRSSVYPPLSHQTT